MNFLTPQEKITSLYESFVIRLNDPKEHLDEHEKFLVKVNINSAFNSFKMYFYDEIKAAGLNPESIISNSSIAERQFSESILNNEETDLKQSIA